MEKGLLSYKCTNFQGSRLIFQKDGTGATKSQIVTTSLIFSDFKRNNVIKTKYIKL